MGAKLVRRSSSGKVCDSGEWTCSCGHIMHHEANFCSTCGRRSLHLLRSTFEADLVKEASETSVQNSEESTSVPEDSDSSSLSPPIVTISRHASPLHSAATCTSAGRHTTPLQSQQSYSVSGAERPTTSPRRSWNWGHNNSPRTTPSAYKGWLRSKSQAELESASPHEVPKHSRERSLKQHHTSDSEPDSSHGTPARRPSLPDSSRLQGGDEDPTDLQGLLTQTLKHSGNLMMNFVRVRVLVLPSNLTSAHNTAHKPDLQMPLFDAKVDFDNLLNALPSHIYNPCQMSMQRVSFMGTDWLGIRLDHQTHTECITFCICIAALLNIGKSSSRTVVIEACGDNSKRCPGFACIPISDRSDDVISTFFEYAKDISDLADIICNEPAHPPKRVTADLKKWCQKGSRQRGGLKKPPRFSLKRMVECLESQFTALAPIDINENCRFKIDKELRRRPSHGDAGRLVRSRRKSCPVLQTQKTQLSFAGICESEEEDETPVQRRATYAVCSASLLPSHATEASIDPNAMVNDYKADASQISGDTSQDRRRYSTGNMLCQRRRSGQLISLRRCSSSTLE